MVYKNGGLTLKPHLDWINSTNSDQPNVAAGVLWIHIESLISGFNLLQIRPVHKMGPVLTLSHDMLYILESRPSPKPSQANEWYRNRVFYPRLTRVTELLERVMEHRFPSGLAWGLVFFFSCCWGVFFSFFFCSFTSAGSAACGREERRDPGLTPLFILCTSKSHAWPKRWANTRSSSAEPETPSQLRRNHWRSSRPGWGGCQLLCRRLNRTSLFSRWGWNM